jgi:hypothetical protein
MERRTVTLLGSRGNRHNHKPDPKQSWGASMTNEARILVVANRTAATPALLEAVRQRADRGPARFHLLVPAAAGGLDQLANPEERGRNEAEAKLKSALPALSAAARTEVRGELGDHNPIAAVEDAVRGGDYDEIIISTLDTRVSRWMKLDLLSRARSLGLPVTHVEPEAVEACVLDADGATESVRA